MNGQQYFDGKINKLARACEKLGGRKIKKEM